MTRRFAITGLVLFTLVRAVAGQVANIWTGENPAVVPVPQFAAWWAERHVERLERVRQGGFDLLFVGDSITQNYEKTGPAPDEVFLPVWQEFFAPHNALNLGYSGDQTQNVLWRLQHGEVDGLSPRNVVLLIGTNNTARREQTKEQVTAGIVAVVEGLHKRLPQAKILLVGILPSGLSVEKSATDAEVNTAVDAYYATNPFVRCINLSSLFMKDGELDATLFYDAKLKISHLPLHPNSDGQRLMADAIAKALFGGVE
jgi:lysophospholipase L1-like esterase